MSFFREYEQGVSPIIIVPKQSIVKLRVVRKNYNLLEVVFKHADFEHKLYYKVIGEKSKKVLEKFELEFWHKQTSMIQLIRYGVAYGDLKVIKSYNEFIYNKYFYRILAARVIVRLLIPFKKQIKAFLKLRFINFLKS